MRHSCLLLSVSGNTDACALEVLTIAHEKRIKTIMAMHCAELIQEDARIHDLGKTKQVVLNEREKEKPVYPTGMVVSSGILFLIMITHRFEMGAMNTMHGFDSFRCVLFSVFGFFPFLSFDSRLGAGKKGLIKRNIAAFGLTTAFVIVYEVIYGAAVAESIGIDLGCIDHYSRSITDHGISGKGLILVYRLRGIRKKQRITEI